MSGNENGDVGGAAEKGSRTWIVVLGVIGALLLLPGACGVVFTAMALATPNDPYVMAVYIISIPSVIVGLSGVWLLRWAIRKYRALGDRGARQAESRSES